VEEKINQSREELMKFIEKKFGKGSISTAADMKGMEIGRIPTGSISLDIELGGGLPQGRLVEIFGWESSGKTYISLKCTASAQEYIKDKNALWIDVEGCFDREWAELVGVDLERLDYVRPNSAEEVGTIIDAAIRANCYSLIVLDSVAALEPAEDIDKAMDQNERIGNRAMINNRIVRKLQAALNCKEDGTVANQTCIIFINQLRETIGVMYGPTETTTGGKGIQFGASIRIEMRRGEVQKRTPELGESGAGPDGKLNEGVLLKFKTVKNKTACPLKTGQFILSTSGDTKGQIDRTDEIMRYSIFLGVIKQSGPSYKLGEQKFLGKENLLTHLKEHPEQVEEIYKDLLKISKGL